VAAVEVFAALIHLLLVILSVALGVGVIWFLVAKLAETVIVEVGVLAIFTRQGHRPRQWRAQPSRMRGLLSESWPLVLSALGAALYLRIDQVMLGQMKGASEVGIYAAAARLSETWYFVAAAIVASSFPYLLQLRAEDPTRYAVRLQQLYDTLAWVAISLAVIVTLLAPLIVHVLYGSAFAASAGILQVHIWAGVFIYMRTAFSKWLVAERMLMFSLVTQGAGAVVNVILNLALIPQWGGLGAAWATVVSYAAASYLVLPFFGPTRPAALMMTKALVAPARYVRVVIGRA
jgi:O-antigen/teichoic acid export membrane protein